jgi:hypothetical protein
MIKDFLQFEGYLPESRIKLKSFVIAVMRAGGLAL